MSLIKSQIIKNWTRASKELGFKIEAPFFLKNNDKKIECVAYLPDFGSTNGMVINLIKPPEFELDPELETLCQNLGLFFSSINEEEYKLYNKNIYMETLLDWSYFGSKENKPKWID